MATKPSNNSSGAVINEATENAVKKAAADAYNASQSAPPQKGLIREGLEAVAETLKEAKKSKAEKAIDAVNNAHIDQVTQRIEATEADLNKVLPERGIGVIEGKDVPNTNVVSYEFSLFKSDQHVGQINFPMSELKSAQRNGVVISTRKLSSPLDMPLPWVPPDGTSPYPLLPMRQVAIPVSLTGTKTRKRFVVLQPGITVISGYTKVGKSTFTRLLKAVMPVHRVIAGEPADGIEDLFNTPIFASADQALMYLLRRYVQGHRELAVLDSLREPLFNTSGGLADKGISNPFFINLSNCSNSVGKVGATVVATINPVSEDPDYIKAFMARLKSSVTSYFLLESSSYGVTDEGEKYSVYKGKFSERPFRVEVPFVFDTRDFPEVAAEIKEIMDSDVDVSDLRGDGVIEYDVNGMQSTKAKSSHTASNTDPIAIGGGRDLDSEELTVEEIGLRAAVQSSLSK